MAKFGFGNSSFKEKMRSFKKDKEELMAKKEATSVNTTDMPEVPEVPEVPDTDDLKDKTEDMKEDMEGKAGEIVDDVKEAADDAAGGMKFKLFMMALKNKFSCCFGGDEESKPSFM